MIRTPREREAAMLAGRMVKGWSPGTRGIIGRSQRRCNSLRSEPPRVVRDSPSGLDGVKGIPQPHPRVSIRILRPTHDFKHLAFHPEDEHRRLEGGRGSQPQAVAFRAVDLDEVSHREPNA